MNRSAELAAQARHALEEGWSAARTTWRDGTADNYRRRFHDPAVDILRAYSHAVRDLEESLDLAEATLSR